MTVGEAWLIGANVVDVRSGAVARDQAVGLVGGRIVVQGLVGNRAPAQQT